jgi:hypothetical protein
MRLTFSAANSLRASDGGMCRNVTETCIDRLLG